MKRIAVLLVVLLAACDGQHEHSAFGTNESPAMQTHCIGHSLIDFPEVYAREGGASAIFTPDQDTVEDGNINLVVSPSVDNAAFQKLVAARHAKLADDEGMTSKLSETRVLPNGGTLLRVRVIDDAYNSEVHWLLDDTYLVASIKSFNNQVVPAEAMLLQLMRNVERQAAPEASGNAFCIAGVSVKGRYRSEFASFHFSSSQTPEIEFSADVDTYAKDEKASLHQRLENPQNLLNRLPVKQSVLRKTERSIAGMRAQEWAASFRPGEKSDQDLAFFLETVRPLPSSAAPRIHLEMQMTGRSAENAKAAAVLWDSVTESIRPIQVRK